MPRYDAAVLYEHESPSAARRFFFRDASPAEGAMDTIQWWEKRRLPYNLAVGAAGLTTLTAFNVLGAIGPNPRPMEFPAIPILIYALLANVMYTGGWISELILRPLFGRKTPVVGATIFRYGFVFSVGLTALPIGMAVMEFGLRVLSDIIN
jgi:hypothetical protein